MKCPECNNKMNWLRKKTLQSKSHYCTKCGYSIRKPIFGKQELHPIYAIGTLGDNKEAIAIFLTKEDFNKYNNMIKDLAFIPLKNSKNIKK